MKERKKKRRTKKKIRKENIKKEKNRNAPRFFLVSLKS
jgi:hypothetical protein